MSTNISTKEITKFTRHRKLWGAMSIFFFLHGKWSRGHILTKDRQCQTPGTPRKSGFSARKRPKEGERVTRRHFNEKVGECPRREKNFGTSGYKIPRFVSEIQPFEVSFLPDQLLHSKIQVLFKCPILVLIFKGYSVNGVVIHMHIKSNTTEQYLLKTKREQPLNHH